MDNDGNYTAPPAAEGEEKKFPPLDAQQILMAQFKIDELHKMDRTPYYQAFRYLCCCLRVCAKSDEDKEEEKVQRKEEMMKKQADAQTGSKQDRRNARSLLELQKAKEAADKEMEEDLANVEGNAFMLLGSGLLAYRKMLFSLTVCFVLMTLFMAPVMIAYGKGSGLPNGLSAMNNMTLSNMGYSSIQCSQTQLLNSKMSTKFTMGCTYGSIARIIPNGIGINANSQVSKDSKGVPQTTACVVNATTFNNKKCSDQMDHTLINEKFLKHCKGNKHCMFDQLSIDEITSGAEEVCMKESQLFVQYTCEITEKEKEAKYDILSMVAIVVMFVSFLFSQLIFYLQQTSKLDAIKFDIATITASDFTVEYEISKEMFEEFNSNTYPSQYANQQEIRDGQPTGNLYSVGMALKHHLVTQTQQLLRDHVNEQKNVLNQEIQNEGRTRQRVKDQVRLQALSDVKITNINFAYFNHELIALLRKRGSAITSLCFQDGGFPFYAKSIETLDAQLTQLIQDPEKYEKIAQPVCAFITFESDDGKNEALSFCQETIFNNQREKLHEIVKEREIMGKKPVYTAATEPSNIIWENRYIVGANYYGRISGIACVSVFILALAFIVIFSFKKLQIEMSDKWPRIELDNYNSTNISPVDLQNFAGIEWTTQQKKNPPPMQGFLEAFCVIESKKKGQSILSVKDKLYKWQVYDSATKAMSLESGTICKQYVVDDLTTILENNMVKYMIIIINFVIRTIVSLIMAFCGCDTESIKLQFVTNVVFICQFFNTGVLPMLCTANLTGQLPESWVKGLNLQGGDTDFNAQWFTNIGATITGAMKINIVMPVALEGVYFGIRTLKRIKDRVGAGESGTKCTTIQQYVNIYAGSLYLMQYKYSAIMTIVYITFMFGAGMPLLFPLASAAFFTLYLLETFSLHYIHQTPPAYDVELNDACLGKLQYAPLLILSFGYWMTTNPQLQQSYKDFIPLQTKTSPFINNHYWSDYISPACIGSAGPGGAMLGFFYVYLIYLIMRTPIRWIEDCCDCKLNKIDISHIEVDEDIPTYQKCLDEDDRLWTLDEERLLRSYGLQTMMDQEFITIRDNHLENKENHLQGTHTYNILRNILYVTAFQYVAANTPHRDDYIIDQDEDTENNSAQSDLVQLVLNAAFLEKAELQALTFDSAGCAKLKAMVANKGQNNMA